jgi:hypothetical protein
MSAIIRLSPTQVVGDRPFADPDQTTADLATLAYMLERLRDAVQSPANAAAAEPPVTLGLAEPDGNAHSVVLARPEALRQAPDLFVVGFFGFRRPEADPLPIFGVDEELIREFIAHPGVYSYSRLQLREGNWGNMVVLGDPQARYYWMTSELHTYAVRELAPKYYRTVRLHNALLSGGLFGRGDLSVVRTRYYDYQGMLPWFAVREMSG